MRFLFPLGLLGLIAVPILIIIYILRNRFKEHIVSSSYLFELSNRFLKKKKRHRFENILSLIIEISAVIFLSIALAHPVFYQKNNAENYCFILDASGSMNIKNQDKTRFALAQEKMNNIVKEAKEGSTYTLIYAGYETRTIVKNLDNKDTFYEFNQSLKPEYMFLTLTDALKKADEYYQNGDVSKLYVFSDKTFESIENVELIDVSSNEENYAIYDFKASLSQDELLFSGNILSYESDTDLTLNLYLDDELVDTQTISVLKEIESKYAFHVSKRNYQKANVVIINEDALILDNSNIIYNLSNEEKPNILLVSEKPFYLQAMINAIGNYSLTIENPSSYVKNQEYDLFIFDSFTPDVLPENGSVWLINSDQNIDQTGFLVQDERVAEPNVAISYNEDENPLYNQITKDIKGNQIAIYKYKKYSLYKDFTTIFNYNSVPLLFVGSTENNLREVVFAFDLHDTDLPLLYDFAPLIRNLLNYSLPSVVEDQNYVVGNNLQINIFNNYESVRILTPSNNISYLTLTSDIEYVPLYEVGTYEVKVVTKSETKDYYVFVSFDKEEGYINIKEENLIFALSSVIKKNTSIIDQLMPIIIIGAIFFILDWVVYAHEQY